MKYEPKVGDKLYLYTPCSDGWVSMVKDPYTVIAVKGNTCTVQECMLIFNGPRYYCTIADDIRENPHGRVKVLRWSEKKQRWQESPAGSYPEVAVFGEWKHQPYLN